MRTSSLFAAISLLALGCAAESRTWTVELEEPSAAFLSVLATDYGVYVVGADDGAGPHVLRQRNGAWEPLYTGDSGDLWWVAQDADGTLLLGGEGGRILRYDPDRASFTSLLTPSMDTVFGIWAAPDGTGWAVASDIDAEGSSGAVWIRAAGVDGAWTLDERASGLADGALFKVWGTAANDVWAVGEGGTVLHFDGAAWSRESSSVSTRLLTIHGQPGRGPMAVGGASNGVLLERGESGFVDRMPELMPGANGIWVEADGGAWVVGNRGSVLSRDGSGAWSPLLDVPTELDLHAVTVDAEGAVWAVGGALLSPALDRGVVVRFGVER